MRFCHQILVIAVLMQLLVSCWARTRYSSSDSYPVSSTSRWNEVEDLNNNNNNDESNSNEEYEFIARAMPLLLKAKKLPHGVSNTLYEELRKKYLGEATNHHSGRSLQGLWAMPGRR